MAIFCLIGQSASGKSSVERSLQDVGYERIISHTTRPMRENEKNGVDYHFVDYPAFEAMAHLGVFAERAQYRDWHYGLSLRGIDYLKNDYIAVVTIHGYEQLVQVAGQENVVGIHIKVEERERMIRQLKRGDEVDEVIRRIHNDRIDFATVECVCNHIVKNDSLAETCVRVHRIIQAHNWKKVGGGEYGAKV